MTGEEVRTLMSEMKLVFPVVRLVDAALGVQYELDDDGVLRRNPYQCYAVWKRGRRCENCVSAKALSQRNQSTKFEFVDEHVYFVVARYLEMDGVSCVLEIVAEITDEILFSAYGRSSFVDTITTYNRKMYVDVLTGAYNRHYYEEQVKGLEGCGAVAMLDADGFKEVNDSFGHQVGDLALRAIVDAARRCMREEDIVVRYGGDEFMLVFPNLGVTDLPHMMERIRREVEATRLPECPELHLTVSIGAVWGEGSPGHLIRAADERLYRAKERRNCVVTT